MLLEDYQKLAFRTNPDLGEIYGLTKEVGLKVNLSHMALGISSEVDEIDAAYTLSKNNLEDAQKNLTDEVGDIMWYVAGWCTFRGYDLKLVAIGGTQTTTMYQAAFKLDDLAKKFLAYGKEFDERADTHLLGDLVYSCQILCGQLDIDFSEVLRKNIEKLQIRYPDKFDQDAAINRDVEAEKKVFDDKVTTGVPEIDEQLSKGIKSKDLGKV